MDTLSKVKAMVWFYEFELPDGAKTKADYPDDILKIHTSRRDALRRVIASKVPDAANMVAADLSSHEGYFSFELASRFKHVHGYEFRESTISRALLMQEALNVKNVDFSPYDIQKSEPDPSMAVDFVLLFGLIYHMENPIHVLRAASAMAKKHMLIDTQIFPYELSGRMEDSAYMSLRTVEGMFALVPDYSQHREGGSTDFALVPTLNALRYLLRAFGFRTIEVVQPGQDYYEQFVRGRRALLYCER